MGRNADRVFHNNFSLATRTKSMLRASTVTTACCAAAVLGLAAVARSFSSSNPLFPGASHRSSSCNSDGAETKTVHPQQEGTTQSSNGRNFRTVQEEMQDNNTSLSVKPIGVVRSVYRLCVGTPRQGLLAPHARGRIEFTNTMESLAVDAVDGLEGVSHIWIVFVFHMNTVGRKQPAKIAPPATGGQQRVGVLATRSPHRFNPIGLTLAKLDGVVTEREWDDRRKKPMQRTYLKVSGLDLLDGTPVLDIKPYVPAYDAPLSDDPCILPSWVSQGLATQRTVELSDQAATDLRTILESDANALMFYGRAANESLEEAVASVTACIQEVLAMDVRSQFQTTRARQGHHKAERSQRLQPKQQQKEISRPSSSSSPNDTDSDTENTCTQQIDNLLVHFTVVASSDHNVKREESLGSGAEDRVLVQSVELFPQSTTATND